MKRAIIVGNGPSLKDTPLHLLKGDTFGVNRISQIYSDTDWRPDYYVRVETVDPGSTSVFWNDCRLHIELGIQCIFPHWGKVLGQAPNVEYIRTCHHYKYSVDSKKVPATWHLPYICDFGTVVTVAMQIAVMKGYEEIYLVGCDMNYKDGGDNHFYNSSSEERQPAAQALARMNKAHMMAVRSCPVPIYNATIGGNLEIYERKDIGALL